MRELRREFEHHGMEAVRGCEFVVANSQIMNYMQKKKGVVETRVKIHSAGTSSTEIGRQMCGEVC